MVGQVDRSRPLEGAVARGIDRISPVVTVLVCVFTLMTPTPSVAQTPGPADFVINELLADPPPDLAGDANGDGTRDSDEDEFIEIVNVSGIALDLSGVTIKDLVNIRHTFPEGTLVETGCAVVVFGGGSPTGTFGGALIQTADPGPLSFTNSGDTVSVMNGGVVIDAISFPTHGCEANKEQSITLDPDLTGACTLHSLTSSGALFSPGTKTDGSPFDCYTIDIFSDDFESGGTTNWSATIG